MGFTRERWWEWVQKQLPRSMSEKRKGKGAIMENCDKAPDGKHCWHIMGPKTFNYFSNNTVIGVEVDLGCCWCSVETKQMHGTAKEKDSVDLFIAGGPSVVLKSQMMDSVNPEGGQA